MRPSTIRLTQPQEAELSTFIKRRLKELDKDNEERIEADRQSDLVYRLQRQARATPGSLFAQSNFPVPLTSWVVDHFSARSEDEVLGRDPCVKFSPQGPADEEVARGINRLAAYKFFDQGTVKADLQKGMHAAFAHRALIVKGVFREKFNEWEEYGLDVLHDKQTGAPVEILNHGFIIKDQDTFTPLVDVATQTNRMHLDADPTFVFDEERHYFAPSQQAVRLKERIFSAPATAIVDSDRFRAPMNVKSLNEADCIAEYYDKPMWWVMDRFTERPWFTADTYIRQLASETAEKKTKGKRAELSKESLAFDLNNKVVELAEVWLERDVLGWGKPQRIVVWYDKRRDVLVTYDFAVKVTPKGRQPFTAIPIWQQEDVWWGYSIPEMLKPIQDYVDLQFNRHSHRNAINSNPVIGEHPDAVVGNKSFSDVKPFDVVELAEGKTIRDWIETFVFPNADQDTQELIEKAIYWVNFWLGISNLARGDYSDVPQNTTLGGQEATLKEAGKLSRRWTRRVTTGIEDHFSLLIAVLIETMDDVEAYTFLEGNQKQAGVLEAARVNGLTIDAKLVVNSDQTSRTIEGNRQALEIVDKYATYLATAPWLIPAVRPLLVSTLFQLGHDNVDSLLPLPPGIPPMPVFAAPQINPPAPVDATGTEQPAAPGTEAPEGTVPFVAPAPVGGAQPQPQNANG